jgi:exodeoxyribonuclease VII small subunit
MAKKKNTLPFEEKLQRIKSIADSLQRDTLSLDESMALFKEADLLLHDCRDFLDQAQLQVEQLIDPSSGETRPFN